QGAVLAPDRRDFRLRPVPLLLGHPLGLHPGRRAVQNPDRLLPEASDVGELPRGVERLHLPARAHQFDDRRRRGHADLACNLLAFIAAWNEYLYALSFIQTPNHYTVPLSITTFVGKSGSTFQQPWGQIMAATVIVTLPLITATLILQRRILAGLTAGAVKG